VCNCPPPAHFEIAIFKFARFHGLMSFNFAEVVSGMAAVSDIMPVPSRPILLGLVRSCGKRIEATCGL